MTIVFEQNELIGLNGQTYQQGVAGAGGTGSSGSATVTNNISLPVYRTNAISTSVSVPDRGTVMLGGQKTQTDYEVEVGVPVLSKIPVVNRFFTNRVNSKAEQNLLLLLRPEIVMLRESEDLLFPGLKNSSDAPASMPRE
jgi:type II secretory pathway component GspD/PulD (secretin)